MEQLFLSDKSRLAAMHCLLTKLICIYAPEEEKRLIEDLKFTVMHRNLLKLQ